MNKSEFLFFYQCSNIMMQNNLPQASEQSLKLLIFFLPQKKSQPLPVGFPSILYIKYYFATAPRLIALPTCSRIADIEAGSFTS